MNMRHDLFVSSTFQDMHAERDLLHNVVIPDILDRFSQYRVQLDLIDLRWGISTPDETSEKENTTKILRVCFDEIERSRPFFIGFIGERYGWIPESSVIESSLLGYDFQLPGDAGLSITELEMQYALQKFDSHANCFFFLRNGLSPEDMEDPDVRSIYFPDDVQMQQRCWRLKEHLRSHYPEQVFDYSCYWDQKAGCVTGLQQLSSLLTEKISAAIEAQLRQQTPAQVEDRYTAEKALQSAVLQQLQKNVHGRQRELAFLERFALGQTGAKELAVISPSGFGKSSLLAAFCRQLAQQDVTVIPFFAGISQQSQNFRFLLQYCYAILQPQAADTISRLEYPALKKQFLAALIDASAQRRVVILVDALDQFLPSEELQNLDWIHDQLIPDEVRIIYTCLPGREQSFRKRAADIYEMDALRKESIPGAALGIARRLHKELPQQALEQLAEKVDENGIPVCSVPIYLVSLLELLCSFNSDDYARIYAAQKEQRLPPAAAITAYLTQTIQSAGPHISYVIQALTEKSTAQLAGKYDLITTLLVSTPQGITEREILGITAGLADEVTAADFSVYRRMFRMHLQQRQDGQWCFTHAIIRSALERQMEEKPRQALWEQATRYYARLPENDPGKYPGLIRAYGRCRNYAALAQACFQPGFARGAAELYALMRTCSQKDTWGNALLEACAPESCFRLCQTITEFVREQASVSPEEALTVCLMCITAMQRHAFEDKYRCQILSDYYHIAAETLLRLEDPRGRSFFEISIRLLEHGPDPEPTEVVRAALQISDVFADRQDWAQAEQYASLALRYAKKLPAGRETIWLARSCLKVGSCLQAQPLKLGGIRAFKHLYRAVKLAVELEDWDLATQAAVLALRSNAPGWNRNQQQFLRSCIQEIPAQSVNSRTYVELLLYRAHHSRKPEAYEAAYIAAMESLAQDNSQDAMVLYEKTAEYYGYHLMLEGSARWEAACDIMQKADRICRKLDMVTGDVYWNEQRIAMANDLDAYCEACGKPRRTDAAHSQTAARTKRKNVSGGGQMLQHKNSYLTMTLRVGLIAMLAVAVFCCATAFLLPDSNRTGADAIVILMYNVLETAANVGVVLAMALLTFMLRCMDKQSADHSANSKLLGWCILTIALLIAGVIICMMLLFSGMLTPYYFDIFFYPICLTFLLSMALSASVTWFVAYGVGGVVHWGKSFYAKRQFRYCYRHRQWLKNHICSILFTAGIALCFVPCLWLPHMDHTYNSLSFLGTTASSHIPYCWIPVAVQMLLSAAEYLILRCRWGKPVHTHQEVRSKAWIKPLVSVCLGLLVLLTVCAGAKQTGKELQFQAYGYRVNNGLFYRIDGEEITVYHYYGDEEHVVIPQKIHGKPVTRIQAAAFDHTGICSIEIPEGVTRIEEDTFADCLWLQRVQLPDSLTEIGDCAFENCVSLREVSLGTQMRLISWRAFAGCVSLERVAVPQASAVILEDYAFYESGLASTPEARANGFYRVGNNIACAWQGFCGELTIPEGITHISHSVFKNCTGITQLRLPDSLQTIGGEAFSGCSSLYYVSLPAALQAITDGAFSGCEKLFLIDNASGLAITPGSQEHGLVGRRALRISTDGTALPERTHDGNLFVWDGARYVLISCDETRFSVTLPETYQGEPYRVAEPLLTPGAQCRQLYVPEDIYVYAPRCLVQHSGDVGTGRQVLTDENGVVYICDSTGTQIHILGCTPNAERVVIDFPDAQSVLVADRAFAWHSGITSVQVTGNVVLSERSFYGCDNLQEVWLDGEVEVGANCFANCRALEQVTLTGKVTLQEQIYEDQSGVFRDCTGLLTLRIEEGTEALPRMCFQNCVRLETISWPASLRTVLADGFHHCLGVQRITYGGTLESWVSIDFADRESQPLHECGFASLIIGGEKLTDAAFGPEVTQIQPYTLYNYRALRSISLTAEHITMGTEAFSFCKNLHTVQGMERIEEIGSGAFGFCVSLRQLSLGEGLTHIGTLAFEGCTGLTEVYLPHSLKTMGETVFQGCEALRKVTIEKKWEEYTSRVLGEDIDPEVIFYSKERSESVSAGGG